MNIIKINASAGTDIDNWFPELIKITKEISAFKKFDDNFFIDLYFSLSDEEKLKLHEKWGIEPDDSWELNSSLYPRMGLEILVNFYKELAVSHAQSFEVHSTFNSCTLVVKFNTKTKEVTSVEELQQQWNNHLQKREQEWQDYLATPEGILYTENKEKAKVAQEKAEKEFKKTLKKISFSFSPEGESKWKICLSKNKDGYGRGILDYAKYWAYLMEQSIKYGVLTEEIKSKTSSDADVEGITGYMYGVAVSILSEVWLYGEQLRKLHNKEYNNEDAEGVVNPAVITVSV